MVRRAWKSVAWVLCGLLCAACAAAQDFAWNKDARGDDAGLARSVPALARQMLAGWHDDDRDRDLVARFRLQLVAGDARGALASIRALRALRAAEGARDAGTAYLQYEIFADAKDRQVRERIAFDEAFRRSFRAIVGALDDVAAQQALSAFSIDPKRNEDDLRTAFATISGKDELSSTQALALVKAYQIREVYAAIQTQAKKLNAEDDARRYVIEKNVLVAMPDGAHIATLIVRPRSAPVKRATLLEFTIYADDNWAFADAKAAAAHGYAGVVAYSRGKGTSRDVIEPFVHDGADAAATIDWIAKQNWSDGRVGMYSGSYNAFTQWAAAKHHPPALKAIATSASTAPGIDVPMEGNVFLGFMYPWPFYVADNKSLDRATYGDQTRWDRLAHAWYVSGQAWREMDRIDGKPNPIFRSWLAHPSYDAWWQAMIPYREEFADIDIPVFTSTGYFDGGQVGALYYFQQHTHYRPNADHRMVIGPFEHFAMQAGVAPVVQGYAVDPVAMIDLQQLRFDWFDHVFHGAPMPALLSDRVNYEVMGANVWRHAHTLEAMANARIRLYFGTEQDAGRYRLAAAPAKKDAAIVQNVDFADRRDAGWTPPMDALTPTLDAHGGLVFAGEPVQAATEVAGLFSGELDFVANKRDLDIDVALYEQLPDGRYFQLAYWLARASYANDRTQRHLLMPGQRQHLAFRAGRITARLLQPGSRLVVVLSVPKESDQQINYGTGKDVSDETLADAKQPLQVTWYGDSFIDVPVRR